MSLSERAVEEIFGLFDKFGHENYIGEAVTQLQHAQQAVEHIAHPSHQEFINSLTIRRRPGQRERDGATPSSSAPFFMILVGIERLISRK